MWKNEKYPVAVEFSQNNSFVSNVILRVQKNGWHSHIFTVPNLALFAKSLATYGINALVFCTEEWKNLMPENVSRIFCQHEQIHPGMLFKDMLKHIWIVLFQPPWSQGSKHTVFK